MPFVRAHPGRGAGTAPPPLAIGVVVPAHNEEAVLEACLDAIAVAAAPLRPWVDVGVLVVLDGCADRSAPLVRATRRAWVNRPDTPHLEALEIDVRNVGAARAAGFARFLARCDVGPLERIWLASTDADSVVPRHWLTHQADVFAAGHAGWVGTVQIDDPGQLTQDRLQRYRNLYAAWDGPDHPHVHGANLGVRADAYRLVDGFRPLATAEDHDLVTRLGQAGVSIARSAGAAVVTSARLGGRAPHGFAGYLRELDSECFAGVLQRQDHDHAGQVEAGVDEPSDLSYPVEVVNAVTKGASDAARRGDEPARFVQPKVLRHAPDELGRYRDAMDTAVPGLVPRS